MDITVELRQGDPLAELVTASVDAAAVVVGSRGLGGFRGLMLGSTAIGLTSKASSPVVVWRGHRSRAAAGLPIVLGLTTGPLKTADAAVDYAFRAAAARATRLVIVHA